MIRYAALLVSLVLVVLAVGAPATRAADSDVVESVVGLSASVPPGARTAASLGTERSGSGVLIDDEGLVLTIGYLVMEAERISIITIDGRTMRAKTLAYDHETGLALLRTETKPAVKPMRLGDSSRLRERIGVLVLSLGGEQPIVPAQVVSVRPFAGYWEYMLDSAIFTAPAHPLHSGAALIGEDGRLYGIGSLFVGDAIAPRVPLPGNMFVPINVLKPILGDLIEKGKRTGPAKPWIGVNSQDISGRIVVTRVSPESPAAVAGLREGDLILGVGGKSVSGLVEFYRALWAGGPAGTALKLNVLPANTTDFKVRETEVKSVDRTDWLKKERAF